MNESWQETITRISKPVRISAACALGLLALFLFVKTLDIVARGIGHSDVYPSNVITVEGTGEATAIPNIATITFSVTESGTVVGEAQTKATAKMDKALAFLKDSGVEEKDIKTTSYNVYPKYENQPPCYGGVCPSYNPRITGYEISQSIEVKVRDTAKAGDVLQGLGSAGVQNISGPNFALDDEDSVKSEARANAIKEARAKAEVLAKQLGVRLGKVVSFYENTGGYPMMYEKAYGGAMDAAMTNEAPAPSLPVGENESSVSVSITYEIK